MEINIFLDEVMDGWMHECHPISHMGFAGRLRYIQQLLGHAKLETTAIYTHVSIQELQAVHARCHPAEKKTNNHPKTRPTQRLKKEAI